MEVYSETSGSREVVESLLEVRDVVGNGTDNDESVVGILQDGTRKVVHKRVEQEPFSGGLEEKLLKHISYDIEEERRQRVTLSKPPATLDPFARDTVEKNSSLTRLIEHFYPGSP
jgi:hypothetical protein